MAVDCGVGCALGSPEAAELSKVWQPESTWASAESVRSTLAVHLLVGASAGPRVPLDTALRREGAGAAEGGAARERAEALSTRGGWDEPHDPAAEACASA